jgi:DNA helicase HerA-like ATPase
MPQKPNLDRIFGRILERLRGKKGADLVLRRSKEAQHVQVSGDTGAGKSTIIRTILYQVEEPKETAIVFDPECEYLKEFYRGMCCK